MTVLTKTKTKKDLSSTFNDNLSLPIHNWFRYSAGFSAKWVHELIQKEKKNGRSRILDPFVGSGTTILEAENCGVEGIGIESHPFVYKMTESKLSWEIDSDDFREYTSEIISKAKKTKGSSKGYPDLINRCYPDEVLKTLDALRKTIYKIDFDDSYRKLAWLALSSILRECSPAGTATWQYVLPNRTKAKIIEPITAYQKKVELMASDIEIKQSFKIKHKAILLNEDCREKTSVKSKWADLVITSPPYANNYDYADATRLEMCFFKEIDGWTDLKDLVRPHLVRSCTQHVASISNETDSILNDPLLKPIANQIWDVCQQLEKVRHSHGGKKPYHTMIATYFQDLAKVWVELRRTCKNDSLVCFVVGDSAPYGVYAPVDVWLGKLAVHAGFDSFKFEKTRDRNVKWKNRKHDVPLKEGRLWVKG